MLGDQRLFSDESEEKKIEQKTRKPRRKKHTLEKFIIAYLIISSIVLIVWKHTLIHAVYLKFVKGQNVAIIKGEIVNLDNIETHQKIIFFDERTGQNYTPEEYYKMQDEEKEKQRQMHEEERLRRIAELDENISRELQKRDRQKQIQGIRCWTDDNGRKIYANTVPGPGMRPCP